MVSCSTFCGGAQTGCKSQRTWGGWVMRKTDVTVAFKIPPQRFPIFPGRGVTLISNQRSAVLRPYLAWMMYAWRTPKQSAAQKAFPCHRGWMQATKIYSNNSALNVCIKAGLGYERKISVTFASSYTQTICGFKVSCKKPIKKYNNGTMWQGHSADRALMISTGRNWVHPAYVSEHFIS